MHSLGNFFEREREGERERDAQSCLGNSFEKERERERIFANYIPHFKDLFNFFAAGVQYYAAAVKCL